MSPICGRHKAWGSRASQLPTPFTPPWSLPLVSSKGQTPKDTHVDVRRGTEDEDNSLSHILGFQTLRAPGRGSDQDAGDPRPLGCPSPSLVLVFPPQPSRKGDKLTGQVPFACNEGSGGVNRPRGKPHLDVPIGGGCFLRVLVMESEGELCLHQAWRDTLGQQKGLLRG